MIISNKIKGLITILCSLALAACKGAADLPVGAAKTIIKNKTIPMFNAQSSITEVGGGMFAVLKTIFASKEGEGVTIILTSQKEFYPKEYKVKFVDQPGIENAQITYFSKERKLYEAVGKTGTGSVKISKLTDTSVTAIFSAKLQRQGHPDSTLVITSGEFHAMLIKPEPE